MQKFRSKWFAMLLTLSITFFGIAPQSTLAGLLNQKTSSQGTSTTPGESGSYRQKNVQRLAELTEMRDQHTKYFRNNDGSITAETSINSRHYKDANGKWQDISNRLVSSQCQQRQLHKQRRGSDIPRHSVEHRLAVLT